MGIFTRFTLRTLAKNRVRTAVTVAGIALSTALLAAVLTSVGSMQNALLERTAADEGSWQIFSADVPEAGLANLAAANEVTDLATFEDLGSARLSDAEASELGKFVAVRTLPRVQKGTWEPGGAPLSPLPEVVKGRLPETADEVALPDYCAGKELGEAGARSGGTLAVGSTLELDLGTRVVDDGGQDRILSSVDEPFRAGKAATDGDGEAEAGGEADGATGEIGDAASGAAERLEDVQTRTYTVVGFYERQSPFVGNSYTAANCSIVALAADTGQNGVLTGAYLSTQGIGSMDGMRSFYAGCVGDTDMAAYFHSNLFRYQGINDGRALWGTLWSIAAVLALVIVAASVSLIYNAFAISVAERTRQFGLLASLGASKRQLRRTVLTEALALGVVGVPLGLALGVAGTFLAFGASQEAFASLVGTESGIGVHVSPEVLLAAAALSFVTLIVSAWVPAARAARVSAVDAIRQTQDVHVSPRAARKAARNTGAHGTPGGDVRQGLAGRLFGVPGFIAHRNLSRSTARGRTVVASLAVSVALIVVTGSLASEMALISGRADSTGAAGSGADIVVSARVDYSESDRFVDLSDHGEELDAFVERARAVEGAQFIGSSRQGQAQGVIPAALISDAAREVRERIDAERNAEWTVPSFGTQGDYYGYTALFYLDDTSWRALVESLGQDVDAFSDPDHPRAIGLNTYQDALSDGTYVSAQPFAATGSVDLYTVHEQRDGWTSLGIQEGPDGAPVVGYLNQADDAGKNIETIPADEAASKLALEVAALADEEPAALNALSASYQFPALILPESVAKAAEGQGDYRTNPFTYSFATFSFKADDHAKAAEQLEALAAEFDDVQLDVTDIAEGARQNRLVSQAIQLFMACFAAITTLIAVANVFNTLANSIILRTREFAMLKSAGMGNRAFARMLAYECASYAVRGLLIGLAVALAAAVALHEATALSFAGAPFTVPWPFVGAAVALVLAVLGLSVAYALRRARAGNIVEALRVDAI